MGDILKKPYEISVWEDRLVNLDENSSYYKEIKIAVIGSDTMTYPGRAYQPIFTKNVNGEKTLTFSLAHKFFDPSVGEVVTNPFTNYLINERKIKLFYDDNWYEFIIKEDEITTTDYVITYTARELFSLELSKVGYNVTLDPELNNNQGTAVELGAKVLEDTDWIVDTNKSDLLQQTIQEPLYEFTVIDNLEVLNVNTNETVTIESGEHVYFFYSYIANKIADNVQFIRANDDLTNIDDNNVITATNYRITEPVEYFVNENLIIEIKIDNSTIAREVGLYYDHQAYRLVYNRKTTYDPIMGRTVDLYKMPYKGGTQEIYHYTDYRYATSELVVPYVSDGSNFNIYEDGSLAGWDANTVTINNTPQHIDLTTYPAIATTSNLAEIINFSEINGYLELKFDGALGADYENTYYNSGFEDNASIIDHISAGEEFVLRERVAYSDTQHGELSSKVLTSNNDGIRAIVAKYDIVEATGDNGELVYLYKVSPNNIVLQFDDTFEESNNYIHGGHFNSLYTQYIMDDVVQTPSSSYCYDDGSDNYYVWDADANIYKFKDSSYLNYYLTTAKAKFTITNEALKEANLGIFIYTKDSDFLNGNYTYVQDIQITRCYRDNDGNIITIGNIPTASSIQTDYFYLKPNNNAQKSEIGTYGSLDDLAKELGLDVDKISPIYNENCEKILSVTAAQSNCFNILQDICETFECWLDIIVPHDERGAILLGDDYAPIKKVAFKRYAGKDNYSGFKYGINLESIERSIDSNEFVTKLIVDPVQCEYTDTGTLSIQDAPSNPSHESYIFNLSYYLNQGLITNADACNKDLIDFYTSLHEVNTQILDLEKQQIDVSAALLKLRSKRTVLTELIERAKITYSRALQTFNDLTGQTYQEYVETHNAVVDKEAELDNLVKNETVTQCIGEIYTASSVINNYSGILTNLNQEYNELSLQCYGAREYGITVTSALPDVELEVPASTQIVIDDYVDNFIFALYNEEEEIIYKSSVNDRIFTATSQRPFKYIRIKQMPAHYEFEYFFDNKSAVIHNPVGMVFKLVSDDQEETLIRKFKLVPETEYAAEHLGYEAKIKKIREDKKAIEKQFYKKYSRFIQEGTWSSQNYIDPEFYYFDALQVSQTSAQPQVSYTIKVVEVSELDGLQNYLFDVGDKSYVEDENLFGYTVERIGDLVVETPVQMEVIVSEVEWHLDSPEENVITVQNYKTRFEDLFQRIAATVQTVQFNENTYVKTSAIIGADGNINSQLLANSMSGASGVGFDLTSNGMVAVTNDGLLVRNLTNSANLVKIISEGIQISDDGGATWSTALSAKGIATDVLTAGTINTQRIWLMDGDNPSFRWDKAGLNAYGLNQSGEEQYDLRTYVRFDKYGLYGIKDGEDYVASSLEDVKDKAHFGVTWDGFFIKNSYEGGGQVEITSDNDFRVLKSGGIEKIKIGALEWTGAGGVVSTTPIDGAAPSLYGIRIKNDAGDDVFKTGDNGNIIVTGTINATGGNFTGLVRVGEREPYIQIDGAYGTIGTSDYQDGIGTGWLITSDGDAIFNNITARGAIKTAVFEYAEIQAVGGIFLFRPSSTIRQAEIGGDNGTDLIVTVEKPNLFAVGDWCKVSNCTNTEPVASETVSGIGLTYVYRVGSVDDTIIRLEGAAAMIGTVTTLEELSGGALVDMGHYDNGITSSNYGIGINSSDNTVDLPRRAISLFETAITPSESAKVAYNYRGILGTLPPIASFGLGSIYKSYLENTQGIYTDNMYIGDSSHYLAFYTDTSGNTPEKKLRISGADIIFTYDNGEKTGDIDDIIADIEVESGEGLILTITSSEGTEFNTSAINTTLTATIYKDGEVVSDIASLGYEVNWYVNGSSVIAHTGLTYVVSATDLINIVAKLEDISNLGG